jgi:hypothetical protein
MWGNASSRILTKNALMASRFIAPACAEKNRRGNRFADRLLQIVQFNQPDAGADKFAAQDRGVLARGKNLKKPQF